MRRFFVALALSFCLVLLITAPYFSNGRNTTLRGAVVYAASRDSYSLSAPVRLLQAPIVDLESGTLSMPPNRTGLARGSDVLAMLITGKSARMTLENATFTTDFSASEAAFDTTTPGGVAPLVAALKTLQFDALGVRDSAIRIKTADGGVLLLDNVTADVTAKPNGFFRAVGSFVFRGEKVGFDTTLRPGPDAQGGTRAISASVVSELLNAKFDGTIVPGESLRVLSPLAEVTIPNLRRAARWLGADWRPGSGFENFAIKGQLEWVNRAIAFQKASVQLDDNAATGTLSVSFAGARPAIDGTLGLKTFDLTKYMSGPLPAEPAADAPPTESLLATVRKIAGLEFPLIQAVDADLRISSDSVVVPRLTIGRSAATISLKGGKLLADIAELEIDEGTHGGGQLRIDASGVSPTYDIRGKLEGLDVGIAAQAVFGHPTIQGHGDVTVEVTAAGGTGDALLRSLGGKLSVNMAEGGLLGIDVNKLVTAVNAQQGTAIWQEASAGAIAVDKLDARFAVVEGKLRTETAEALSGGRKMTAEGAIDLPARAIDVEFAIGDRAQPDGTPSPSRGEVIDMHGPWTEPDVKAGGSPQGPR